MFPDYLKLVRCFIAIVIPFFVTKKSADMYFYFRNSQLLSQGKDRVTEEQEKKHLVFKPNRSFQGSKIQIED
jgi:hypothetical protein